MQQCAHGRCCAARLDRVSGHSGDMGGSWGHQGDLMMLQALAGLPLPLCTQLGALQVSPRVTRLGGVLAGDGGSLGGMLCPGDRGDRPGLQETARCLFDLLIPSHSVCKIQNVSPQLLLELGTPTCASQPPAQHTGLAGVSEHLPWEAFLAPARGKCSFYPPSATPLLLAAGLYVGIKALCKVGAG